MKLKFHFWHGWGRMEFFSLRDGRVDFLSLSWTRDIDFWGFKVVIFNFSFGWSWKGYQEKA